MKKIIIAMLMSISFFASASESNISIQKEKFEVVIQDGVETIFKTSTLKPVMIFEEVITITNISKGHLRSVIYDFSLDNQSTLFSNMDLGDDVKILYSNNDGKSYSKFPILNDKDPIPMQDYTNVKMTIKKIMNGEKKKVKIRYSYDHFAQ